MPYDYKFHKGKGKDIELPNESGRTDPRLPKRKPSMSESLRALKGVAGKAKQDAEEFKRRVR